MVQEGDARPRCGRQTGQVPVHNEVQLLRVNYLGGR